MEKWLGLVNLDQKFDQYVFFLFFNQYLILSSVSSAGIIIEPFADVLDGLFPPGHLRQDVDGRIGEVEALLGEACSDHAARGPVDWKSRGKRTFKKN